jgi:RNA polymerase sigma-70 factor (ECF subfamily)
MNEKTKAIEDVYARRYLRFRNALAGITGSYELAHDAVQESFARALARRGDYRGEGPLEAWIWKIALRVALDMRRAPTTEPLLDSFEPELPEPEYDDELAAALRSLAPRRRLVVFLRFVADLDYASIAEICEISEGTVAATLSQASTALKKVLGQKKSGPRSCEETLEQ